MTASIQNTFSHVVPETKSRTKRTSAQKKAIFEEFNASGLTKTAFCQHHGIATSRLSRWQKALTPKSSAGDFVDITESVSSAATAPRPAPEEHPRWQVELELGAGVVLRVRTG